MLRPFISASSLDPPVSINLDDLVSPVGRINFDSAVGVGEGQRKCFRAHGICTQGEVWGGCLG